VENDRPKAAAAAAAIEEKFTIKDVLTGIVSLPVMIPMYLFLLVVFLGPPAAAAFAIWSYIGDLMIAHRDWAELATYDKVETIVLFPIISGSLIGCAILSVLYIGVWIKR
jgi:hypothetical protein